MDAKIEYLKMIQAVITRMPHYGFLLKGWGVALLAAILALAAQSEKAELLLLVGIFPVFVFWGTLLLVLVVGYWVIKNEGS